MTDDDAPAASDAIVPEAPGPLQWQAHPWHQESPLRSTSLLVIIFIVATIAAWSFGQILYGLGSALLLLVSTSRYLLPTRFQVDRHGVTTIHLWRTRRLDWQQIARIDVHRDGLFLSPFRQPSRLDGFRGLFVRYADNSGAVAVAVDQWYKDRDTVI